MEGVSKLLREREERGFPAKTEKEKGEETE